jgi:hypothetical protein
MSKTVNIRIYKSTHKRVSACREELRIERGEVPAGNTVNWTSELLDEALASWLEKKGLTYDKLVERQLLILNHRTPSG